MQVRPGNVLEMKGRLLQVMKFQHTQGAGRQLGNVQASLHAGTTSSNTFQMPCTHRCLASVLASYKLLSPGCSLSIGAWQQAGPVQNSVCSLCSGSGALAGHPTACARLQDSGLSHNKSPPLLTA